MAEKTKKQAEDEVEAALGFRVRPTGSFLDFPKNKKRAYCYSRAGEYVGDARMETVALWEFAVRLQRGVKGG